MIVGWTTVSKIICLCVFGVAQLRPQHGPWSITLHHKKSKHAHNEIKILAATYLSGHRSSVISPCIAETGSGICKQNISRRASGFQLHINSDCSSSYEASNSLYSVSIFTRQVSWFYFSNSLISIK